MAKRDEVERETGEAILDAAHTVFLRRGTAGARMQEVADEAGVNKALLHYYFRSKEGLAEAVFTRAARRLFPPVLAIMGSEAAIEEKVEQIVEHELEILSESPYLPGYLMSEIHHHPERLEQLMSMTMSGVSPAHLLPPIVEKLRRQIDKRVEAGTLRPISPEQFIINLIALCVFPFAARPMLELALGQGGRGFEVLIEERKRTLAAFFLNAMRP
ncbi:MAG: TetR family transcriptional regulator [Gemmatimonas sp.]|nr:TetR family transcriptional regulator [Gemmatimonas sp.]